jgi:hypothetical protein
MLEIVNIKSDPIQKHYIPVLENQVEFTLRFYPTIQIWCFDIEYKGVSVLGLKASLGTTHLTGNNFPFDFVIECTKNTGLDPYLIDDFETRIKLYMLEPDEIAEIRGYSVAI